MKGNKFMTTLEAKYVSELISQCIQANSDEIQNALSSCLDDNNLTPENIFPKMIVESISISSEIAVKIILEILTQADVVSLDETALKKLSLNIVK